MKQDLGFRYKKVKELSVLENSVRNLVLRQQFALRLLNTSVLKTRVICIDESFLNQEDFRRMKWQAPGTRNSIPKKSWTPRISVLLAFDNFGESYVAMSQSNTNSSVINLFIRDLVRQLNEGKRNWRKDTLIYWDNAPYHKSAATLKLLEELQVPIMFSGPHSYDTAPCELWFALFKKVNINIHRLKTGKG
jgi:hypothetical protein